MDKLVISFMSNSDKPKSPDNLFGILDLNSHKFEGITLSHLPNVNNFVHGMGICYNQEEWFCAGIIPIRERLASNLLMLNLLTGEKKISYLYFTKAIHGLKSLDKNRLLANNTQNDIITEITFNNGHVLCEDLYRHFVPEKKWKEYVVTKINGQGKKTNYRGNMLIDDNHHVNSICIHHNDFYCTMFGAKSWEDWGKVYKGVLFDMTRDKVVIDNLNQPHTAFVDSHNNICCCDSSNFTFIVKDKFITELDGYTRGICEDLEQGGYWIGISAYRKQALNSKWVEKYRGEQPLKGAKIQFVDYNGKCQAEIDLANYGEEIFDLLPFREGYWN